MFIRHRSNGYSEHSFVITRYKEIKEMVVQCPKNIGCNMVPESFDCLRSPDSYRRLSNKAQ